MWGNVLHLTLPSDTYTAVTVWDPNVHVMSVESMNPVLNIVTTVPPLVEGPVTGQRDNNGVRGRDVKVTPDFNKCCPLVWRDREYVPDGNNGAVQSTMVSLTITVNNSTSLTEHTREGILRNPLPLTKN